MEVCLSEFSSVPCLTLSRDTQRSACASQWASCSDQLQTEGRRPNRPIGATLSEFRGVGAWIWFRGLGHTQIQTIPQENSHDLGHGSAGEVANSTSSGLLEKLIVCKLANKFPEGSSPCSQNQPFVPNPSYMNGVHSSPAQSYVHR